MKDVKTRIDEAEKKLRQAFKELYDLACETDLYHMADDLDFECGRDSEGVRESIAILREKNGLPTGDEELEDGDEPWGEDEEPW